KRFGQCFLIDGNLLRKLVAAAGVTAHDVVLEVGPGTGTLTEELLAVAGHVLAVEIDNGLAGVCRERFGSSPKFTLLHADVLACKSRIAPQVLAALAERRTALGGRAMLVANLPYQAATPLLIELMMSPMKVSPLCFTVQAEVADRLVAPPGGKDYGPISVFAQASGRLERIARVPPEAFWPAPRVESAMLRWDADEREPLPPAVKAALARVVHACFNHRRKTMRANLRELLNASSYQLIASDGRWDLADRPERLGPPQWLALARLLVERETMSSTQPR
ncbi:MAG: ribosomal RNA small subunit methyltransferase A, partial [Phycisphaerae bacterium]